MAPRLQLRSEAGTSIVEVVVAAVILLIAAGAVASLVDAAQRDSGQQRIQAVATDVGQAQMEELRTLRFDDLIGLDEVDNLTAAGIQFTVRRRSDSAMSADPGAVGCSSNSRNPEALRVTTTVTWPQMRRRPVRLESLVAAPTGGGARRGGFTVQVGDRDGFGVSGLAVTMTGPATMTGTTDGSGCVRFNDLPAGTYSVTAGRSGWLQPDGATSLQRDVTVVTGTTATTSFEYDAGGRAQFRFVRADGAASPAPVVPSVILSGPSGDVTLPGPATSFTSPLLYPAAGQYAVKPDTCPAAASAGGVTIPKGATAPSVDLALPVLTMQLRTSIRPSANLFLWAATPCGTVFRGAATVRTDGSPPNQTFSVNVAMPGGALQWVCGVVQDLATGRWYWLRDPGPFNLTAPTTNHPRLDVNVSPRFATTGTAPAICAS